MLGLGKTEPEVIELMAQLREAGCDLLSIGQYLPPSLGHYPVARFVPPEEFEHYEAVGRAMGFPGHRFQAPGAQFLSGSGGLPLGREKNRLTAF